MIKLYTGIGGMELFNEAIESQMGFKRIYLTKVPRFLKGTFKKSLTGRQYKLVKKW